MGESSPRASCQNSGFAVEPRLATRTPRFHDHFILVPKKVQPNRFRTLNYVAPLTLSTWPCIFGAPLKVDKTGVRLVKYNCLISFL